MASRVGIIGGAFDPIHIGHLIITQFLISELDLQRVIFVPSLNPPHKKPDTSFEMRHEMTVLGTEDNAKFEVSDIEKDIPGISFTKQVVEELKKMVKADFHLIIGSDQYLEIETWYKPEELANLVKIVVVPRPGYQIGNDLPLRGKIVAVKTPLIEISSTLVRNRIRDGKPVRYLVPDRVLEYIRAHQLYR